MAPRDDFSVSSATCHCESLPQQGMQPACRDSCPDSTPPANPSKFGDNNGRLIFSRTGQRVERASRVRMGVSTHRMTT